MVETDVRAFQSLFIFTHPSAKICQVLTHDIKQEGSFTEVLFGA